MSDSATIMLVPFRAARPRMRVLRKFQRHVQRIHELVDLDGLGEIVEESGLEALLDVAGHRIGAERDDRDMRRRRVCAQDFHRFDPADAGQVDVHQDHLRLIGARELDAEIAVRRAQQAQVGAARDELLDQLQVGRIVFHVEQRAQRRAIAAPAVAPAPRARLPEPQAAARSSGSTRPRTRCPPRRCFPRRWRPPSARPAAWSPPGRCPCLPPRRPPCRAD